MSDDSAPIQPKLSPQHSTEAPCSANVRANVGGYDWQITVRSHVDRDDLLNMTKAIKWFNAWLDNEGAMNVKAASKAINIETQSVTATVTAPAPVSTSVASATSSTPKAEQSFAAVSIAATIADGKTTWRIKGGQFEKFGVICYPEVLKAAQLELDPMQAYSLTGWTAFYAVKDDGKPQKVTRLVKA